MFSVNKIVLTSFICATIVLLITDILPLFDSFVFMMFPVSVRGCVGVWEDYMFYRGLFCDSILRVTCTQAYIRPIMNEIKLNCCS